jgi:hypothetical protein
MRRVALFAANLAAPLAWLLFLQTEYALVPWACRHGSRHPPALYAVAATAFATAAASALLAWREWRLGGRGLGDDGPPAGRIAFMALTGLGVSVLFALVILSASLPMLIFAPCD